MDKRIVLPFVSLAIGGLLYFGLSSLKKPPQQKTLRKEATLVAVQDISFAPLTLTSLSYGVAEPKETTSLVSEISGTITELSALFDEGNFINKGDLLARIDAHDYQNQLIEAQANLASAQASLELEKAQSKVAQDEWKKITNQSPSELSLRKPQLAQEIARVKAAQAALSRAEKNLQRTEIRAPYDALIGERSVSLGSFVRTGELLGKVMSTSVAEVKLPISQTELQYLDNGGIGASVTFTTSDGTLSRTGKVARSSRLLNKDSRQPHLIAQIIDPYRLTIQTEPSPKAPLRFGTYLKASISGITLPNAAEMPYHLIKENKVYVMDDNKQLQFKSIDIVQEQDSHIILQSNETSSTNGLKSGDKLVVSALAYPYPGMPLKTESLNTQMTDTEKAATETAANLPINKQSAVDIQSSK